jgi:hypothetical protein
MRRLVRAEYLAEKGGGGDILNQLEAAINGESSKHKKVDGR